MSSSRRRLGLPLVAVLAAGCYAWQPHFVAIDPEYGFVDGCTDVVLQGNNLGTTATATVGGADLPLIAATYDDGLPAWAQDVGFKYFGVTPPKADGQKGFVDVVMTVGGKALTLPEGFYYRECPGEVHVESADPTVGATPGASVDLHGCNLDAPALTGHLLLTGGAEAATFTLTSACGTGVARFEVPDVPQGWYWLQIDGAAGATWGGACDQPPATDSSSLCPGEVVDTGGAETDVVADSDPANDTDVTTDTDLPADSDLDTEPAPVDTGDPCAGLVAIKICAVGGA